MTILEASRRARLALENVDIRGERSIAAMSLAMSLIKGIEEGLTRLEDEKGGTDDDGDDRHGQDV